MGIGRKLVEGFHGLDFSKRNWHSLSFPVCKILFKKPNSIKGFIVLPAPGDKDKRRLTSFILKADDQFMNLLESVVDEVNVVGGVDNFLLNEFSVGNGLVVHESVGVLDSG